MRFVWVRQYPSGGEPFGTRAWFLALLIRWLINATGLLTAAGLVSGIELRGWQSTLITAALFGLINAVVRPVVLLLTCLLQVLTLGLFILVVNAAMLELTAWLAGPLGLDFAVHGFWAAFLGALIISLVSFVLTGLAPSASRSQRSL